MKQKSLKNLTRSAMFLALGLALPFLTGQLQPLGNMLLPMHFPVFLCGMICGWQYGFTVGLILPLLRSVLFTMPILYPTAIAMALELACYGAISGLLFRSFKRKDWNAVYVSLISAMMAGRAVWGIAEVILLGLRGISFTAEAFALGAFVNAFPGIILQLVLIPAVMLLCTRLGVVSAKKVASSQS